MGKREQDHVLTAEELMNGWLFPCHPYHTCLRIGLSQISSWLSGPMTGSLGGWEAAAKDDSKLSTLPGVLLYTLSVNSFRVTEEA